MQKITVRFCSAIQYYQEAIDSDSLIVNSQFFSACHKRHWSESLDKKPPQNIQCNSVSHGLASQMSAPQ